MPKFDHEIHYCPECTWSLTPALFQGNNGIVQSGSCEKEGKEMKIFMTDVQNTIIRECSLPQIKRNSVAITYRFALEADKEGREKIDWAKVNAAIINRWSKSGLQYIKERAWKGEFK